MARTKNEMLADVYYREGYQQALQDVAVAGILNGPYGVIEWLRDNMDPETRAGAKLRAAQSNASVAEFLAGDDDA